MSKSGKKMREMGTSVIFFVAETANANPFHSGSLTEGRQTKET
jgi:hypothetical protein